MNNLRTFWLADARTFTVRPVEMQPCDHDGTVNPDGEYWIPIDRRERDSHLGLLMWFDTRAEAEADIELCKANGDWPLNTIRAVESEMHKIAAETWTQQQEAGDRE